MIFFPVFSTMVFCLWALLLSSGQISTPILIIPALISPALAPLLSPLDGSPTLILSEVCVRTVAITFPTCHPTDTPVPTPSPPVALGPHRGFQLVVGLLISGCAGIVLCTIGTTRPPSPSPFLHPFPPAPGEANPRANWTPLSQSGASGSLRRQVLTRNIGVSMSGRIFRALRAGPGHQRSPLLSRRAAYKRRQSRLRVVISADASPEGLPSTPFFNPTVHQCSEGGWTSRVVVDDPFWAAGFTGRGSVPPGTPSELTVEIPPLSPLPLRNRIPSPTGYSSIAGVTAPIPIKRTGVSDRRSAREARDAFLYLQAERGYAAPSRLYCNFVDESSTPPPARTPNIQALRDLLESGKATLRRFQERRSAWPSPTDIRSRSLGRHPIAEERASATIPIYSAASRASESLEKGPTGLEESRSTFDPPAGVSMLVDGEMVFDEDEDDPSYPTPPFETVLVNSRKGKPASIAKALDIPAATSADIGLRLLVQAIGEQRETSLYLGSEASYEATMSVDLTLGEFPSFLNDTYLSACHYSQPVVVFQDQHTQPAPPFPAPAVDVASSDAPLENTAIASDPPLSPLHNPTTSPSATPFETSLSSGLIDRLLKDILGTPVHRFSRPALTFEAHDTRNLALSSSSEGPDIAEDLPLLMNQSAPPSPVGSRSGSSILPFGEVISRVRRRKAAAAAKEDQVTGSTRDLRIVSTGTSGRLDTSMSLGRIADLLCDIWDSPVHKFSNGMRFEGSPSVNPSTSSSSVIRIPEDMSYLMDQTIPSALAESSSGPATSVPSFKNLPGMAPPLDVLSTGSKSRSTPDLGSPYVPGSSPASLALSRPRSSSSGCSLTMEIPENTTLLCEELIADLDAVDGSWC